MPENNIVQESRGILGQILASAFEVANDAPFDDLLKMCDESPHQREYILDRANNRLTELLNSIANTQIQIH